MALAEHQLIDRYFAAMRGRDLETLVSLFAETAVMVLPDGRQLDGVGSIRAMYEHLFASDAPIPTPSASIVGPHGVATEIETRLRDGASRQTANLFHLNESGLIRRLSIYMRG